MKKKIITELEKLQVAAEPVEISVEDVEVKEKLEKIITDLTDTLTKNESLLALSAPQIGKKVRIVALKFNDGIKILINPVITKKLNYSIGGETFASMPGKEILIIRPEEVRIVYYNDKFKYEDNKFLNSAARLLDQQIQLLDGVLPSDLGLVSDIEQDGKLEDLTEEEWKEVKNIYTQLIKMKSEALTGEVEKDEELSKTFKEMRFAEKVISDQASIVEDEEGRQKQAKIRAQIHSSALQSAKAAKDALNKTQLKEFLRRNHK